MVTSENDSDEILTLDWPSITITVRDYAKKRALCPHDRKFTFLQPVFAGLRNSSLGAAR
jgi:hypothetical protein